MIEKTEILPCPFCSITAPWFIQSDDGKEYWVECGVCKAQGPKTTIKQLASFEWNRRRLPDNGRKTAVGKTTNSIV